MSMLSHHPSNVKKKTYRASGWIPTRSSTYESGTPVHSAMKDHPSSHAWCVIWLRDGKPFSSAREREPG